MVDVVKTCEKGHFDCMVTVHLCYLSRICVFFSDDYTCSWCVDRISVQRLCVAVVAKCGGGKRECCGKKYSLFSHLTCSVPLCRCDGYAAFAYCPYWSEFMWRRGVCVCVVWRTSTSLYTCVVLLSCAVAILCASVCMVLRQHNVP